jgi:hypothetical protein
MSKLTDIVLPLWARLLVLLACGAAVYLLGQLHGERIAGQAHIDYVLAQAKAGTRIAQAQSQVIWKTDVQYRDRIQTIYVKRDTIEKSVPVLVTPADNEHYGVNAGFVRSFNAAWANEPAGPATESDHGPAAVPLADIAEAEAANAASCHVWREQTLGLRELYQRMKHVMEQGATAKGAP